MRNGLLRQRSRSFLMGMPPLCKGRWPGVSRVGGIDLLQCLRRNPAPPPGTLRWARFLPDEKSGKESLRAFPPKNLPGVRGWNCVKAKFGPSPLLWPLILPPHQATLGSWPYSWVISMSGPTLAKRRSRRREPGCPSLGTASHQGKALAVEAQGSTEAGTFCGSSRPSM